MIPNNQPEPVRVATEAARALGRSPSESGTARLAAALAEAVTADICEQEACEILAALPGAHWVQAQCGVWYIPSNPHGDRSVRYTATMHGVSSFERYHSGEKPTMREAVEAVVAKHAEDHKTNVRKAIIAVRIEKELAEADAAEAALKATAPLEFRADGSPADTLPIVSIGPFGIGGEGQREVNP